MNEEVKPHSGKEKKRLLVAVFLVLLAGTGLLVWFLTRENGEEEMTSRNLSSGLLPGSNEDYSNAGSESIRVQINSRPEFMDGESEGNLYIGNPDPNQYDMEVIITLDETGEEVYNSGLIPPGYYIDNDKLDVVLEAGEHAAQAAITYYLEGGVVQTKANVKLVIVVKE